MHKYMEKKNEVNFDKIFNQVLGKFNNYYPRFINYKPCFSRVLHVKNDISVKTNNAFIISFNLNYIQIVFFKYERHHKTFIVFLK